MGEPKAAPYLRRKFGTELRKLRVEAGMRHGDACGRLGFGKSRLTRMENGEVIPEPFVLEGMLDRYGVPSSDWGPYLELASDARERGWWHAYGISRTSYVALEDGALSSRNYELAYVPGLLQTEDYVRALISSPLSGLNRRQLESAVDARLIRQRRLTSEENPLELTAIVDESALYRPIGGAKTMRAQLEHILMMIELPQLTVRVVPTAVGYHAGLTSSFAILRFPEDWEVVSIEHAAGSAHIEKEEDVRRCKRRFELLQSVALNPVDSAELIERAADGL